MNNNKVYHVTTDAYGCEGLVTLFSSEEQATEYADRLNLARHNNELPGCYVIGLAFFR